MKYFMAFLFLSFFVDKVFTRVYTYDEIPSKSLGIKKEVELCGFQREPNMV